MDILSTCCFMGCRKLPPKIIGQVLLRLHNEVEGLIKIGVTTYISSGAPGFEQIAASLIVARKEMNSSIRLKFVLPCRDQEYYWDPVQRKFYNKLLAEADQVIYMSDKYCKGCIKKQIRFVVDHSSYCISAFPGPTWIDGKAARYAGKRGLKIINVT